MCVREREREREREKERQRERERNAFFFQDFQEKNVSVEGTAISE